MSRNKQVELPPVEFVPELGKTYFTCNARIDDQTLQTKFQVAKIFQNRFGYVPEKVFFGPPNGSLLYAGPLTRDPSPPATEPGDLQTESPTQPPLF